MSVRIWPHTTVDPAVLEGYFARQEGRGLRLDELGRWLVYFDKGEPRDMQYRIAYFEEEGEEAEARRTEYAARGWEHVCFTAPNVHIFRARPGVPAPRTDPEDYAKVVRRDGWSLLITAGLSLALILLLGSFGALRGLLFGGQPLWYLFLALGLLAGWGFDGWEHLRARRRLAALRRGDSPMQTNSSGAALLSQLSACLSLIFSIFVLIQPFYSLIADQEDLGMWRKANTEIIRSGAPVWPMDEILDGTGVPYYPVDGDNASGSVWYEARRAAWHGILPLARCGYEQEIGRCWDGTISEPDLPDHLFRVRYYELRGGVPAEIMTGWLLDEMELDDPESYEVPGLDACLVQQASHDQATLVARRGRELLAVRYNGTRPEYLPDWARMFWNT